jgi:peptidoglycan hydrolase-like protein with peptidoglycan-binding domain
MSIRDLELGMIGNDVLALQKLLNASGFILASSGAGAPGSETTYFGTLTKAALGKYQAANGIFPTAGYFGPLTRAQMKDKALAGLWW